MAVFVTISIFSDIHLKLRYYILMLSALLLIPLLYSRDSQSNKPLVREILQYRADSVIRHQFYYDEFMNKVMEVKHIVRGTVSEPRLQTEWIFDKQRCVMQRTRIMKDGKWVTTSSIETVYEGDLKQKEIYRDVQGESETISKAVLYEYDNQKLKTVRTFAGNPELVSAYREVNLTYNELDSIADQQITLFSDTSTLRFLQHYTYNNAGRIDSVILKDYNDSVFVNAKLSLHYYNERGLLRMQVQKTWNPASSRWINAARLENFYNEQGRLTEEIYTSHSGMFWKPDTRYTYSYDESGLLAGKTMYQPVYKEWRRFFSVGYAENLNDRPSLMESKYNFWGGNTGDYVTTFIPFYFNDEIMQLKADRVKLSYIIDATAVAEVAGNHGLRVYPNPSDGIFYISTQSHIVKSWEVFNMGGVLIKSAVNQFQTGVVDITGLPPGAYLLRVRTANQLILNQKIFLKR